jgi:hypothetical protein
VRALGAGDADSTSTATHSFVLKIWREETPADTARWRGRITHVPSGRYRYFDDLLDVLAFVAPYLEGVNMRPRFRWRLWRWFYRM